MSSPEEIYLSIAGADDAVSISHLLAIHPTLTRRTLQRWVSQLVQEGRVVAEGEGRSRRYRSREGLDTTVPTSAEIPLSADSRDILQYIGLPIEARSPIGYQREFLDDYQPNTTFYLPAPIRRQLARMGDTKHASKPAGTYGREILSRLLIDLSWASSHLEGNTYSRLDTLELIEHGKAAEGKETIETQMILNHKAAIELLVDNAGDLDFNRYTILNLHSSLSENLLPNPSDEGRIRKHAVDIGKSVYRPVSGEPLIAEFMDVILNKARAISDVFEQSFFILVHLPYLQPFAGVNKRTSRLAANLPLIRANLCPLTFLDVPAEAYAKAMLGVYEMTRVELLRDLYVWAYERSTQEYLAIKQELVEPDPIRLRYRNIIKKTVYQVVVQPDKDPEKVIEDAMTAGLNNEERINLMALIIEELRRLHDGVLARYGLRPSQLRKWEAHQKKPLVEKGL